MCVGRRLSRVKFRRTSQWQEMIFLRGNKSSKREFRIEGRATRRRGKQQKGEKDKRRARERRGERREGEREGGE